MTKLLSPKTWSNRLKSLLPHHPESVPAPLSKENPKGQTSTNSPALNPKREAALAHAVGIEFLATKKSLDELLPGADVAEVVMLPRLIRSHKWAMPEHELLVLGAIIKMLQPNRVIEFGTFRGGSTLAIASNMPELGKVITVDIDPSIRKVHEHGMGTGLSDFEVGCLFKRTQYEDRIEQRFVNTVNFSDSALEGKMDLVFVDADHTYEFAKRDTATAAKLVRDGGWILWHDYTWEPQNAECAGVTKAVNEFMATHGECIQIAGTRFAIHQYRSR